MARGARRAAVEAGPVDGPWELPAGWRWERLGTTLPLAYGKALPARSRSSTGRVAVYGSSGPVGFHDEALTAGPSIIVGRKGSAGAVHLSTKPCWPIDTAYYVNAAPSVDLKYGYYLLQHLQLGSLDQSTAIPSLGRDTYSDIVAPFPPPDVQGRIVARIDELFAEIDDGERALSMAGEAVENYRRALLKAVTTGSLAGASGEADDPSDDLPLLPEGWRWTRLGDMATISGGITKNAKRSELPDTVAYLRVANVYAGRLDLSEVKRIGVSKAELSRFLLVSGDLLIVEGNGSIEQIGRSAIWDGSIEPCAHQNHLIKVRFANSVFAEWIQAWLQSPHGRRELERQASSTSGLHTLSISKVEGLRCPSPPMGDVDGLVRQLAELRAQKQEAERQLVELATAPLALRQSILAAAFRGDLVA